MNKWLYRAVGAVGVASGALLLSNGVAHAQAANDARPDLDPQAMRGLVAEFFTPMGQHREEFIGGGSPLGALTGGGGTGGLLGGLSGGLAGGSAGSGFLGGLTGSSGPVGGLTSGLTGGLTSSITGPDGSPLASLSDLTARLTGLGGDGGGPLGSLTGANGALGNLTGANGPLSSLTSANGPLGGLTAGDGLSGITGALTGKGEGGPLAGLNNLTGLAGTEQLNPIDTSGLRDNIGDANGIAVDGPAADIVAPSLRGPALDTTAERPIQLNPAFARQANGVTTPMVQALIADAVAKRMGIAINTAQEEENLPIVGDLAGLSAIAGPEGPLKDLLGVGNLANQLPLVGDVLNGKLDPTDTTKLPVVRQLLDRGLLTNGSTAGLLTNGSTDGLLTNGSTDGLPIVDNVPFIGPVLSSIGNQTMGATSGIWQKNPLGDLLKGPTASTPGSNNGVGQRPAPTASQVGARGQAGVSPSGPMPSGATPSPSGATTGGTALNGRPSLLPAIVSQAPVPSPAGAQPALQATQSPIHAGRHRATDRPEVADPELEAAPGPGSLPLVGSLTSLAGPAMGGNLGTLPLSTLVRNMPLVNDVPLVSELGTPLMVFKAMPLVGSLAGLVPVESDTAA